MKGTGRSPNLPSCTNKTNLHSSKPTRNKAISPDANQGEKYSLKADLSSG